MAKIQFGGKITASHQTITDAASEVINKAMATAEVTKVSLGIIKHIGGGGRRSIKFLPIPAGTKAVVRGSGSVQEIYLYTESPALVQEKLLKIFE
jgi:hypothetical protein